MRLALLISLALHVIAVTFSYLSISGMFSEKIKDSGYVVFDFVAIGPKSKAPVLSTVEGRASRTKAHAPEKESVNVKNQPSESVAPKKEQKPEPKKEEKEIKKEEKKDDDAIAIKDKNKKEKPKKKEEPKKKEPKKDNKTSTKNSKTPEKAVVNLRKNKKNKENIDPKAVKKSINSILDDAAAKDDNENSGIKAEEVGEVLTATQIDLIRQTIRKCWHFPAGLKNAEDLIVDLKMELDPEGTVKKAEIVDTSRMGTDPDFKIAAENAHRAVLDPECNPLPLPKDKYDEWKELELSFNPKDMFN